MCNWRVLTTNERVLNERGREILERGSTPAHGEQDSEGLLSELHAVDAAHSNKGVIVLFATSANALPGPTRDSVSGAATSLGSTNTKFLLKCTYFQAILRCLLELHEGARKGETAIEHSKRLFE